MNFRFRSAMLLVALAVLASGCSGPGIFSGSRTIRCVVRTNATRAGLITTESIKTEGFVMSAYAEDDWHDNTIATGESGSAGQPFSKGLYFTETVSFTSGQWLISGEPVWINNVPITFWCWNAGASFSAAPSYTVGGDKELSFAFNLPTGADSDLVFAYNAENRSFDDNGDLIPSESYGSSSDDKVNIDFIHALSEVNFIICTDASDDSFDPELVIDDISLDNISGSGSCVLSGPLCNATDFGTAFDWTPSSTKTSFSRNFGPQTGTTSTWKDIEKGGKSYRKTGGSFFVIPQTCGSSSVITLEFTDGTSRTASIATQEFKPGYYYTYKLSAHAKQIGFTATLVDWGNGGTYTLTK